MRCPSCTASHDRVVDSRLTREGAIRRRRECLACRRRFTTYERLEETALWVRKKDGRRERFQRGKIIAGLQRACEKRPVSLEALEGVADEVEKELRNRTEMEVSSEEIGERVIVALKSLDEIAYVRFASVYRQFQDVGSFLNELKKIVKSSEHKTRR
ncbi:MAG: transcriptional regulator NrdR [bacterium]